MSQDGEQYGTVDLAEATVLASKGYEYELVKSGKSQARWIFEACDDEFWSVTEGYREGECRVEPRTFMKDVKNMRSELYKFLGPDAPKRPSPAKSV